MSYTIIGERYFNDFNRKNFRMTVSCLDELFEKMKRMSDNFSDKYSNYFPTRKGRADYDWCGRISCADHDTGGGWDFWVYQIESENGIVYSTGRLTDGQKFCAKKVEEWLGICEQRRLTKKPNFVEN